MGDVEEMLVRQMRLAGEPIPEHIAKAQKIGATEQFWYQAFFDLDTERTHGQGLTKIPRSAIVAYAAECGLNEEEKQELIYVIRTVDNEHLSELAKKQKDANAA